MDEASYSVASLAERWHCLSTSIHRLIRTGELESFSIGSLVRISVDEVRRWETLTSALLQIQESLFGNETQLAGEQLPAPIGEYP